MYYNLLTHYCNSSVERTHYDTHFASPGKCGLHLPGGNFQPSAQQ